MLVSIADCRDETKRISSTDYKYDVLISKLTMRTPQHPAIGMPLATGKLSVCDTCSEES